MKRNLLLLLGFVVRFVSPVLVLLRGNLVEIYEDPRVGFTVLFSSLLVVLLIMLNRTFKNLTEDLTNGSPMKYFYHQVRTSIVFTILIGISIGIATYLDQIWFVLFVVGIAWVVSEHIFYLYYRTEASKK